MRYILALLICVPLLAAKDIDPIISEPCQIVTLPNGQQGCKP